MFCSQGKAWKLVRGALRQRRRDQERQKKKDGGSDNLIHERGGGGITTVTTVTNGVRRGASEGSLASLAQHRATHRRDRSLDSDGGLSDDSPFDTVRSDASDNPPNASHSQRPSFAHVQFTDGAEGAAGAAGGEGVDLAPVAEGAECNGRNGSNGHQHNHHNHDQSSQSSDNEREGSLSDGSFDTATWNEPSGAKAAESLGSAEVGTLGAGEVSIAVVNAAARHVRKGVFSLPFRKTTRAMQKLRPKRMDSAAKPGSPVSNYVLIFAIMWAIRLTRFFIRRDTSRERRRRRRCRRGFPPFRTRAGARGIPRRNVPRTPRRR